MIISKEDWLLFREKLPEWQERYMKQLNDEYSALLDSDKPASQIFWSLEKKINEDKHKPGVALLLRKSEMINQLAIMLKDGTICRSDLSDFSNELKAAVIDIIDDKGLF